jgi:uncharacterized protein YihD (DUF1040 family)
VDAISIKLNQTVALLSPEMRKEALNYLQYLLQRKEEQEFFDTLTEDDLLAYEEAKAELRSKYPE